jgi:hypothetical protein
MQLALDGFNFLGQSETKPSESEAYDFWEEFLIFVLCLSEDNHIALQACNRYIAKHTHNFKPIDSLKSASILHRYLCILIFQLSEAQPLSGIPYFSQGNLSRISQGKEILLKQIYEWLPSYEKLVTQIYPFPQGENESFSFASRHQRILKCYDWWVHVIMFNGKYGEDTIADYIERHYKLLEVGIIV